MNPNIFATIFYCVTFIFLFSSLFFIKKTEKKLNVLVWIAVALMSICGFQVFVAALINLIKVPVNIISLGFVNGIAGAFFWYQVRKNNEKQKYYFDKWNIAGMAVLVVLMALFVYKTCGLEFAPHYLAVDAAAHYKMAMHIVNTESVYGMYFAALHHGIIIELFGIFVSPAVYYKLFVISDMMQLLFTWVMFYCLIQKYAKDRFLKAAAIIVTVLYGMGYPANSTLFGFVYLGTGITIITYLMIVFEWFVDEEFKKEYSIALLSLGCLSIFESYVLFMPVVFFAILFGMFCIQFKKKKLVSVETIKYGLSIFLMPTILGLLYTYLGTFGEGTNTTVSSAISAEGGIYRDLFSNYAILIPFVLFAFVNLIKEKKNKLIMWMLPLLLVFIFALLITTLSGVTSSYYYYKNYYMLWLVVFEFFFIAITYFEKEIRLFLAFGFLTWGGILFAFLINAETAIQNKVPLLVPGVKAGVYNDIYGFNRDAMSLPRYPGFKLDLYRYANENLLKDDVVVAIASSWEDWYWMEVITGQTLDNGYHHWDTGEEVYFNTMYEDADYVIVMYESQIYQNNIDLFSEFERIHHNGMGMIIKVK